jgi:hypothetical protein
MYSGCGPSTGSGRTDRGRSLFTFTAHDGSFIVSPLLFVHGKPVSRPFVVSLSNHTPPINTHLTRDPSRRTFAMPIHPQET